MQPFKRRLALPGVTDRTTLASAARERLRGVGPRLRHMVRHPSRATLANAVALLALVTLAAVEVSTTVSLVSVIGLVILLRIEHLRDQGAHTVTSGSRPPALAVDPTEERSSQP